MLPPGSIILTVEKWTVDSRDTEKSELGLQT